MGGQPHQRWRVGRLVALCMCNCMICAHMCKYACPWHYSLALNASSTRYTYMCTRGSWYPRVYILYESAVEKLFARKRYHVWVGGRGSLYLCAAHMWCILAPTTDWKYAFCVWVHIGRLLKPGGGWHTFSSACPPVPMPVIYILVSMCLYMCTCESIQ